MLKKFTFKLSALVCLVSVLTLCGASVFAAESITLTPPVNSSDYFLNQNFTALPSGTWNGGGLAAEAVSGTWARNSAVVYDSTNQALKMGGYMEAVLTAPITARGEYVFEVDVIAPDGLEFSKDGTADKYQFMVYDSQEKAQLFRPIEIGDGGTISICGTVTDNKIEKNKWYTLRGVFSLPAGQMGKGFVIEKESGTIIAQGEGQSNVTDIKKPLRCSYTKGVTNNLYTQNWRFYKNDLGTAVPISNPIPPQNEADYYINGTPTATGAWTGGASQDAVSGNYQVSGASYSVEKGAWNIPGGKWFQANITSPALTGGLVSAGLETGAYGMEMDFMIESLSETAKNIDMVTVGAVQTTGTVQKKTPTFVAIDAKTGEIKLFTSQAGTAINTGKNVTPDNWYTAKMLLDLDAQKAEVTIFDQKTGEMVTSGRSDISTYQFTPLYCVNRVVNSTNVSIDIKNFKFYRNSTAANIPVAVFEDANGQKIESAQPGSTVTVVPTIANTTGSTMNCTFITALYKSAYTLVSADVREYSVAGSSAVIWTPNTMPTVTIPNDGESYTVKCYLWDSMDGLTPLAAVVELPASAA